MRRATPYLLVDAARVRGNVSAMAALARERGLALRPHAKTHKCLEVARLQLEAGAAGLTVATVSEAETFAAAGIGDLFIAYPLWVDESQGARLRRVAERSNLSVGVDSTTGAQALAAELPGARVLVEVDSGHHRSGVVPDDAGVVARGAAAAGLDVAGVFTFPGHGYAPGSSAAVAAEESAALRTAVASLSREGLRARVVSGGSTPTAAATDGEVVTEMRPGVYVFGDAQQWELGTIAPERIALTCVTTVVSHAGGNVVLDAGSKVLGADRAGYASGYGRLLEHPDARITSLSEHHAVVAWPEGTRPALGSRVEVVPNHVCNAVNLANQLVLADERGMADGRVMHGGPMPAGSGAWRVVARGANT